MALIALLFFVSPLRAEVVRVEISERDSFAEGEYFGSVGPYEKLTGKLFLEVSPDDPANARVVDLKLASRNDRGRVEFWTDFVLLKPVDASRGNRRILYEVNNRGSKLMLGALNDKGGNNPVTRADAGNGFLMRQGYSVLWCGWNGDVFAGSDRLLIGLPIATNNGKTIKGRIHAEIRVEQPSYSQPLYWGYSYPYPAVSLKPEESEAVLTMRADRDSPPIEIPRGQWSFARFENNAAVADPKSLYVHEGFRPGWLYDLVYTGKDPRVTGLGLAAVRDVISYFKYADGASIENPLAGNVERAYIFGISQSGRFIHHFVHQGFNSDEQGRMVFDAALAHVAGGGRGYFNARFAQTTRHGSPHEDRLYPADMFPFSSTPTTDPETGETGDSLSLAREMKNLPKMFFTQTSTEYWCRSASLLHTDPEGKTDVPLDPNVRIYFLAGGQHGVSLSTNRGILQNPVNVYDHRPALRALLVALDRWATTGEEPPESRYPKIAGGTLVEMETWRAQFPKIPGAGLPPGPLEPYRLDFGSRWVSEGIADNVPPKIGKPFHTLVPAVDADGMEISGIRLPDIAVPIATITGWNPRGKEAGAEGQLSRLTGSYLLFASTADERTQSGDPRPSIRERYPTHAAYLARVAESVLELERDRLLLDEDGVRILRKADESKEPWSN